MSTNGINGEDADMAECDGEKVVTMMDVLEEQQEFEDDANAVLGASDDKNCTYSKGYIKRQAIYACLTCCSDAKEDPAKRAGVCLACSLTCHENHDLIELYTKRNFRCDCGNPKFNRPCQYTQNKTDLNDENSYNQNFSGLYCICHRPYPDPEGVEEEMIQCIICEDWLHSSHLEATVPSSEAYAEMICKGCMEKNEFLHDYGKYAVNGDVDVGINEFESSVVSNGDSTVNNMDEAEKGEEKDLNVPSESKEIKADGDVNIPNEPEKELKDTNPTEETDSSLSNNDANKAKELTEPKSPVEKTDDEKPSEKGDTTKELSEPVNNVADEIAADQDLSKEQNSTGVANAENAKDASEILTKTNEQTTDNADNAANVDAENIANVSTKDENNTEQIQQESSTDAEQKTVTEKDADATGETAGVNKEASEIQTETNETETDENKMETETSLIETESSKTETNVTEPEISNVETVTSEKETSEIEKETNDKEISKVETVTSEKETSEIETETNDKEISKVDTETNLENSGTKSNDQQVDSGDKQMDSSQTNEECSANKQDIEMDESSKTENNASSEAPSTPENKRKLSIEDTDDISVKKPKLEETCVRPKNQRKVFKGATFWPSHFRQKLCTCSECIAMYKDLSVLFLMDPEDTVSAYEALGKERTHGTASTQYEKGLEALSSLGRIQQINALTEYNKMRDKLLDFLKSFKDRKEVVKEEDIKAFFAGMKPKREPDGVYFCR